jgi:hypothetical protein
MPNAWVHATIDLIAYGRSYFDLHKRKDQWSKTLGSSHRIMDHDWYWKLNCEWNLNRPFPIHELHAVSFALCHHAEEIQSYVSHDYWDRIWNGLSPEERKYDEAFFLWLLIHPSILKDWAGVDVLRGKIHRSVGGTNKWYPCPAVRQEYRRLRAYAESVKARDPEIRRMLSRFG